MSNSGGTSGRGGRRKGAGRRAGPAGRKRPFTVWLDPEEAARCAALGGTVQSGLRRLVAGRLEGRRG